MLQIGLFDPVKPGRVKRLGRIYQDTPEDRALIRAELEAIANSKLCNLAAGVFEVIPPDRRRRKASDGGVYYNVHLPDSINHQNYLIRGPQLIAWLQRWVAGDHYPLRGKWKEVDIVIRTLRS